jgi:hypothetical protein
MKTVADYWATVYWELAMREAVAMANPAVASSKV